MEHLGHPKGTNIMVCSLLVTGFRNKSEHYRCSLFVDSMCYKFIFSLCCVSISSLCHVYLFSLCYVFILSLCYVRFLVSVLCGVSTRRIRALRVWLASLASGRFAAAGHKSKHYCVCCSWFNVQNVSALDVYFSLCAVMFVVCGRCSCFGMSSP